MKSYMKHIVIFMFLMVALNSCSTDSDKIEPVVNLANLNIRYTEQPGSILLEWDLPENPQYYYLKLQYYDPKEKKDRILTLSAYTNSILIENTRRRYGNVYNFKFTPYSESDTPGIPFELKECISGAAEKIVTTERIPLNLIAKNFTANSIDASNPLSNICDGSKDTFFHSNWNASDPHPMHWINIDLGTDVDCFEIHTWNRKNSNNNFPNEIKLFRLNSLNDETVNMDTPFYTYTHPNKKGGGEATKLIPTLEEGGLDKPIRYLRFFCKGTGGTKFWHLAEMEITRIVFHQYDPEVDEKNE